MKQTKVLIAGVPYGRDNVGDEAIIATIVASVKEAIPDCAITVSTDQGEATAAKLGVRTVQLFGFKPPGYSRLRLIKELAACDIFIWGGATGLSDYPKIPVMIGNLAKALGKKLVLYSVGMNTELNPAHYKLHPGKKMTLLRGVEKLIPLKTDLVKFYENQLTQGTLIRIKKLLNRADLIIVRDHQTKELLFELGVDTKIHASADPALLLKSCSKETLNKIWYEQCLWTDNKPIIGIGISSQREVNRPEAIAKIADYFIEKHNCHVLFIPMNYITDYAAMEKIKLRMKHQQDAKLLSGFLEPEEITAIAANMALVISSRLHLLILASISCVPIVGLSRGNKIDNFLRLFGEKTCGSVEDFDPEALRAICERLLTSSAAYKLKAAEIVRDLQAKARNNITLLGDLVLGKKSKKVIYISRRFNRDLWGGTETVIINSARELEQLGYEIKVFTTTALATKKREIIDDIPIYRYNFCLPWFGLSAESKDALLKKGGNLLSFSLIWALIKEKNVELIHTHVPKRIGASGRFAAKLKRIPYLITLHGGWFAVPQEQYAMMTKPFAGKLEWGRIFGALLGSARIMDDAAAIICVGEDEYKEAVIKHPGKIVKYLPNGVNIKHFEQGTGEDFRNKYGLTSDDYMMLCVSRIDFQKNQLFLVTAMAELIKEHPEAKLVLIGSVSVEAYYQNILDIIIEHQLQNNVIIIPGLQPDDPMLIDAFKAADCFTFATLHEPFGIVILEAWAAKKPVLSAPTGGIAGFTENGIDCIHFNPGSLSDFLQKIKQLITDTELAEKIAAGGHHKAAIFYDWAIVLKVLAGLYKELTEKAPGSPKGDLHKTINGAIQ